MQMPTPDARAERAFFFSAAAVALAFALQVEWLESAPDHFVAFCGITATLGLAAWLYSSRVVAAAPETAAEIAPGRPLPRTLLLPLLVLLLALAVLYRDLRSTTGAWLWLAGIVGIIALLTWHERRRTDETNARPQPRRIAALAAVVLLALAVRVYRLEQVPGELVDDEALIAEWGMTVVHGSPLWDGSTAERTTLFRKGGAAEPMLGCVVHAAVMSVAGETVFGLRLTAAIAGVAGVALLYLVLCEFLRPGAALGAAFLLAVAHTHLFWTRSGMLQSLVTMVATGVILAVLRGLRSDRYLPWVAGGALLGLAQHLYEGGRFLVPILAPFFVIVACTRRDFVRRHWHHVAAMAAMAVAVFAPLGFWYLQEPQTFLAITKGAFIFDQPEYLETRYPGLSTTEIVLEQLRKSLYGFAVRGDGGTFYPIWTPLFDPILRALVLAGIAGFTLTLRPPFVLVSLWLWVPIAIACTVTVDPPPMSRLMLAMPALFGVAGGMLDRLGALAERGFGSEGARVASATGVVLLGAAALWNLDLFFVRYPRIFPINALTRAAQTAAEQDTGTKVYFVGTDRLSSNAPTVRFLARGVARDDVAPDAIPVQEVGGRSGLFLIESALATGEGDTAPVLDTLRRAYPGGEQMEHRAGEDVLFYSFRVGAEELAQRVSSDDAYWREPALRFGWSGRRPGELFDARALAVDPAGEVYVANTGNRRIDVFDAEGKPLRILGAAVGRVWAVAPEPSGTLLALNRKLRRLQRLSPAGEVLAQLGRDNHFDDPIGIAAAPGGDIVVLDAGALALVRLSSEGEEIGRVGTGGNGPGQFDQPAGLAVGDDGRVYVADQGNRRVQRFSPALEYETEWQVPPSGRDGGQVIAAGGGHVYVVDAENHRVLRFDSDGHKEWNVGGGGPPPAHLAWPVAVALDARGNLYVLDDERGSVYRYDVGGGAGERSRQGATHRDSPAYFTPVNSSDTSHNLLAASGSRAAPLQPTTLGAPQSSPMLLGPM